MTPFVEAHLPAVVAIAASAAFLCGLRPFAVTFCLGVAAWLGWLELPAGLELLRSGVLVAACGVIALAERFADALALHGREEDLLLSALRVPLGAVILAAWLVESFGAWGWLGLPLGAAFAGAGQALKAAFRAMGGLLGWRRTLSALVAVIDLSVPALLVLAASWPWASLGLLGVLLFVALPAAVWWVRELRSRWRRWAAMSARPSS